MNSVYFNIKNKADYSDSFSEAQTTRIQVFSCINFVLLLHAALSAFELKKGKKNYMPKS